MVPPPPSWPQEGPPRRALPPLPADLALHIRASHAPGGWRGGKVEGMWGCQIQRRLQQGTPASNKRHHFLLAGIETDMSKDITALDMV
uniref:Uncharacterized protein n=1 Tax=Oryza glumipatula TaxID=40148 RepID=A0A0E0AG03_9ORYZ